MELLFETSGVAPHWPLERMQVGFTFHTWRARPYSLQCVCRIGSVDGLRWAEGTNILCVTKTDDTNNTEPHASLMWSWCLVAVWLMHRFWSVFPLQARPVVPWPALSSALLRATEWLQWNVMTTDWTKPCIHGPSSHSGGLRLGALITEWGVARVHPPLACPVRHALPSPAPPHKCQHLHQLYTPPSAAFHFIFFISISSIHVKDNVDATVKTQNASCSRSVSRVCLADLINGKRLVWFYRKSDHNHHNHVCNFKTKQVAKNRSQSSSPSITLNGVMRDFKQGLEGRLDASALKWSAELRNATSVCLCARKCQLQRRYR